MESKLYNWNFCVSLPEGASSLPKEMSISQALEGWKRGSPRQENMLSSTMLRVPCPSHLLQPTEEGKLGMTAASAAGCRDTGLGWGKASSHHKMCPGPACQGQSPLTNGMSRGMALPTLDSLNSLVLTYWLLPREKGSNCHWTRKGEKEVDRMWGVGENAEGKKEINFVHILRSYV